MARVTNPRRVLDNGTRGFLYGAAFSLADGVAAATIQAANAQAAALAIGDVLSDSGGRVSRARRQAHEDLGRMAWDSVKRSYARRVTGRSKGPSGYRAGASGKMHRYAAGAMARALNSDEHWHATANGLGLINGELLDKRAKQWHRLNFGAGARGRGALPPFTVRFGSLVVGVLGLEDGPSKPFGLPAGLWLNGAERHGASEARRGLDEFAPGRMKVKGLRRRRNTDGVLEHGGVSAPRGGRRPTKGIAGYNFLDAGVARLGRELGPVYERMLVDLCQQGAAQARRYRPLQATVTPKPQFRRPRPAGANAG